jgi:peptide/nickel transport system permease protein
MAEVWRLDFVLAAKVRGISRRRIVLRHVARNALLPLITMLGLQSASMLGGSVVIETVFSVPGLGRLAQEAVAGRDTPLLLGIILVSAVLVIVINLIVDILYGVLDPRVGSGEAAT